MWREARAWKIAFHSGVLFKLYPGRDAIAMKHRRLDQAQRRHASAPAPASKLARCRSIFSSISSSECGASEPYCGNMLKLTCASKTSLASGLKDSNADGLFLQFVDAGLAALADGLEDLITDAGWHRLLRSCVRSSARAMAAGCAIDLNRPHGVSNSRARPWARAARGPASPRARR